MLIKKSKIILRGGEDGERLYLKDLKFKMADGRRVYVKATNEPGADMPDMIARSKGRYGLLALFSRPGYKLLDFPCGAGCAAEVLKDYGVIYQGFDYDPVTVEYARRVYGDRRTFFGVGNLCSPKLGKNIYGIISCIEGLEHIDQEYQEPLIDAFYKALKPGGVFVVSSPENTTGISGPSKLNPYHKWELNKKDFLALIGKRFGSANVELLTYQAVLSPGLIKMACLFGICHKPDK